MPRERRCRLASGDVGSRAAICDFPNSWPFLTHLLNMFSSPRSPAPLSSFPPLPFPIPFLDLHPSSLLLHLHLHSLHLSSISISTHLHLHLDRSPHPLHLLTISTSTSTSISISTSIVLHTHSTSSTSIPSLLPILILDLARLLDRAPLRTSHAMLDVLAACCSPEGRPWRRWRAAWVRRSRQPRPRIATPCDTVAAGGERHMTQDKAVRPESSWPGSAVPV